MKENTLIFGYGDVVQKKYLPVFDSDWLTRTFFVETKALPGHPNSIIYWKSPELDKIIQSKELLTVVVSSSPNSHRDILTYLSENMSNSNARVFIEKPFMVSMEQYTNYCKQFDLNTLPFKVYCIDHYLEKSPILWLANNFGRLSAEYGLVESMEYISYETKDFANPESFYDGYPIEHGVHALPCFEKVIPGLRVRSESVKIESTEIENAAVNSKIFVNFFDFRLRVNSNLATTTPEIALRISAGKLQISDKKELIIDFEKGRVISGINTNIVNICGSEFAIDKVEDPYRSIFSWIYGDKKQPIDLLTPKDAMRSVHLMELTSNAA